MSYARNGLKVTLEVFYRATETETHCGGENFLQSTPASYSLNEYGTCCSSSFSYHAHQPLREGTLGKDYQLSFDFICPFQILTKLKQLVCRNKICEVFLSKSFHQLFVT